MNDQMKAIWQAGNFLVLDTETTGLKRPCEIIDIAILDADAHVLVSTLLCPKRPISAFISDLTGITNDMVQDAAYWPDLKPLLLPILKGRTVITYNAIFDRHMMHCSDDMWLLEQTDYHDGIDWACAMEAYAPHHKEWDDYHQSYRWAKLGIAMAEQGLPQETAHRAEADAMMTWRLLDHMCK